MGIQEDKEWHKQNQDRIHKEGMQRAHKQEMKANTSTKRSSGNTGCMLFFILLLLIPVSTFLLVF